MAHIAAYQKRLSGPLLDRIDLRLTVSKINHEHFLDTESLSHVQHYKVLELVRKARLAQAHRYNRSDYYNAYASIENAKKLFRITPEAKKLLNTAASKLGLSSRAYLRVLRVARTIADLESSPELAGRHVAEGLQFR